MHPRTKDIVSVYTRTRLRYRNRWESCDTAAKESNVAQTYTCHYCRGSPEQYTLRCLRLFSFETSGNNTLRCCRVRSKKIIEIVQSARAILLRLAHVYLPETSGNQHTTVFVAQCTLQCFIDGNFLSLRKGVKRDEIEIWNHLWRHLTMSRLPKGNPKIR